MLKLTLVTGAIAPLAAAVTLAAPLPATAHVIEQRRETVVYSDLDLTDARDVARLSARVTDALQRVCGWPLRRPLFDVEPQRVCVARATALTQPQVARAIATARLRTTNAAETVAEPSPSPFAKR